MEGRCDPFKSSRFRLSLDFPSTPDIAVPKATSRLSLTEPTPCAVARLNRLTAEAQSCRPDRPSLSTVPPDSPLILSSVNRNAQLSRFEQLKKRLNEDIERINSLSSEINLSQDALKLKPSPAVRCREPFSANFATDGAAEPESNSFSRQHAFPRSEFFGATPYASPYAAPAAAARQARRLRQLTARAAAAAAAALGVRAPDSLARTVRSYYARGTVRRILCAAVLLAVLFYSGLLLLQSVSVPALTGSRAGGAERRLPYFCPNGMKGSYCIRCPYRARCKEFQSVCPPEHILTKTLFGAYECRPFAKQLDRLVSDGLQRIRKVLLSERAVAQPARGRPARPLMALFNEHVKRFAPSCFNATEVEEELQWKFLALVRRESALAHYGLSFDSRGEPHLALLGKNLSSYTRLAVVAAPLLVAAVVAGTWRCKRRAPRTAEPRNARF